MRESFVSVLKDRTDRPPSLTPMARPGAACLMLCVLMIGGCSLSARDDKCVRNEIVGDLANTGLLATAALPVLVPLSFVECGISEGRGRSGPPPLTGNRHVLDKPGDRVPEPAGVAGGTADTVRIGLAGTVDLGRTVPTGAIAHVERIELGGAAQDVELVLSRQDVRAIAAEKTPLGERDGFSFLVHLVVTGEPGDRVRLAEDEAWSLAGTVTDEWAPAAGLAHGGDFEVWEAEGARVGISAAIEVVH